MEQNFVSPSERSVQKVTLRTRNKAWLNHRATRFAETIGIYNYNVRERLEGHYWLFCNFKRDFSNHQDQLPVVEAYILQYRANHGIKYAISRTVSVFNFMVSFGKYYPDLRMHAFNKILVTDGANILADFLAAAEIDLEQALNDAMEKVRAQNFFRKKSNTSAVFAPLPPPPQININITNIQNVYNNYHTKHDVHFHTIHKEGAKGKEAGVFSKKQVLILFDLLRKATVLEKIDLAKVNKFHAVAALLHALTGKSEASFIEELNNHKDDLYVFHTPGQRDQLIRELTNLADKLYKAGFLSLYEEAIKIINQLEKGKG